MAYFQELRQHRRILLIASVGMASGATINNYLGNVFLPPLMAEFKWSRSLVALVGVAPLLSMVSQPLAGHLADRIGVRSIAIFGSLLAPLVYVCMGYMSGDFGEFLALTAIQVALVASTTGAVIYSRLIVREFRRARGSALAIITSAPSVAGAAVVPILTRYIDDAGWRSAYLTVACVIGIVGLTTALLIPRDDSRTRTVVNRAQLRGAGGVLRNRAFWLIVGGMALCSLSLIVQTSQLKLIIESSGVSSSRASWLISLYAAALIVGRMACGAALDRFPPHLVALVALGMPALGLSLLAGAMALPLAVVLLGLSLGSELDIAGYLVVRYFGNGTYGTVLGIVVGAIAFSGAIGSLILSATLFISDAYQPFLLFAGLCALVGAAALFTLHKIEPHE